MQAQEASQLVLRRLAAVGKLDRLFRLEKTKRGKARDALVFVGMSNVAHYYWCAMQTVLKSRHNELEFFDAYLSDRLKYSLRLGLTDRLPKSDSALLEVGSDITFDQIEKLLQEEPVRGTGFWAAETTTDKNGQRVMVINPDFPPYERQAFEEVAKAEGIRIATPEEFPKLRGEFLESTRAEKYPSIRWNFNWERYVIIGAPDGITGRFVYEFKTTGKRFLMLFVKPVALTQADLYGHFFKRDEKRVQIFIVEEQKTETWQDRIDRTRAEAVLRDFSKVDSGWLPPAPKPWKCNSCEPEFKQACAIRPR